MRDPELRSPQEWAEKARAASNDNPWSHGAWSLSSWNCDELAERMDDLSEALRLLREYHEGGLIVLPRHEEASELLAKYQED